MPKTIKAPSAREDLLTIKNLLYIFNRPKSKLHPPKNIALNHCISCLKDLRLHPSKDLLTAIRESRNHFDKEYCFKLVDFMPKRLKAPSTVENLLTVIQES